MVMFTAEKIRELRAKLKVSGAKLAGYLGVSENAYRRWEMGDRHPRWEMMETLNELQAQVDSGKIPKELIVISRQPAKA